MEYFPEDQYGVITSCIFHAIRDNDGLTILGLKSFLWDIDPAMVDKIQSRLNDMGYIYGHPLGGLEITQKAHEYIAKDGTPKLVSMYQKAYDLSGEVEYLREDNEFLKLQKAVAMNTASELSKILADNRERIKHIKRQCRAEMRKVSSPFLDWLYYELKSIKIFKES